MEYVADDHSLEIRGLGFRGIKIDLHKGVVPRAVAASNAKFYVDVLAYEMRENHGRYYYFFEPFYLNMDATTVMVLPYLIQLIPQPFAQIPVDRRVAFANYAIFGRAKKTFADQGKVFQPLHTSSGRTYLRIANDNALFEDALETFHVLGNNNEVIMFVALGSRFKQPEIRREIEALIDGLDFYPDDPTKK